ncbi:MAG: DNA methyltransferase [Deltaproteobacteria bacterium]|nr:DNA methyltransferase [Deltaproteobacteria bacterium]
MSEYANLSLSDETNKIVEKRFVNLTEASSFASAYLNRAVSTSNISYLIQYGRIKKFGRKGNILIDIEELRNYYNSVNILPYETYGAGNLNSAEQNIYRTKENKENSNNYRINSEQFYARAQAEQRFNAQRNGQLSFSNYTESERTKHVHRIHPYKGKFIPQLVEYFLDTHIDEFKKEAYFRKGDVVLDPFCGSGTTLVQSNELNLYAIGIEISPFNALIGNIKVGAHPLSEIRKSISDITYKLTDFQKKKNNGRFIENLNRSLSKFNNKYFPSPEYKIKAREGGINEKEYGGQKEKEFLAEYERLVKEHNIEIINKKNGNDSFNGKWFLRPVKEEVDFIFGEIQKIENTDVKKVLAVILSRAMRSCRATTHADLATLKEPILSPYYCKKHSKVCKPLFTIKDWWKTYAEDTTLRLEEFQKLRTNTFQLCLCGDSRNLDIYTEVNKKNVHFYEILKNQKIRGVFSSPPYVGLIDYHEQHAYAYELFGFEKKDEMEIGSLSKGSGKKAREAYVKDISDVLINSAKYLQEDHDIFLVANDKYNLYPEIVKLAGMKIVNRFNRPVLNRVEKDRGNIYSETIFHIKAK